MLGRSEYPRIVAYVAAKEYKSIRARGCSCKSTKMANGVSGAV